jgi:hypothetical protein
LVLEEFIVNKILLILLAGFFLNTAQAKSDDEEDFEVVLPQAAQSCILPAAPDAIAPQATYDQLVAAKKGVADFQVTLETYRACLNDAESDPNLTAGNKQAMVSSFNYSVDMEERVAERFNEAVRGYKERKAKE